MNPTTLFLAVACLFVGVALGEWINLYFAAPFIVTAVVMALSLKMANACRSSSYCEPESCRA
jgi:hypothetical protein